MSENTILGLLVCAGGLFSIVCAAMDFDWFIESYRARFIMKLLGRRGARIFYVVLGASTFCMGVAWFLFGGH